MERFSILDNVQKSLSRVVEFNGKLSINFDKFGKQNFQLYCFIILFKL